jgi:hypothetical protein
MPIVIREIVTEVVLSPEGDAAAAAASTGAASAMSPNDLDLVVRRASERVLEILRREWDQ